MTERVTAERRAEIDERVVTCIARLHDLSMSDAAFDAKALYDSLSKAGFEIISKAVLDGGEEALRDSGFRNANLMQENAQLRADLDDAHKRIAQEEIHSAELKDRLDQQSDLVLTMDKTIRRQVNELNEKGVRISELEAENARLNNKMSENDSAWRVLSDRKDATVSYIEAQLASARSDALEEAAKVAESTPAYDDTLNKSVGIQTTGQLIAWKIRHALAKPKDPT